MFKFRNITRNAYENIINNCPKNENDEHDAAGIANWLADNPDATVVSNFYDSTDVNGVSTPSTLNPEWATWGADAVACAKEIEAAVQAINDCSYNKTTTYNATAEATFENSDFTDPICGLCWLISWSDEPFLCQDIEFGPLEANYSDPCP